MPVIIEIKARCQDPEKTKEILLRLNAEYKGRDHQIDTYYNVASGRLKLREGNIENNLIYYHRADQHGPKKSEVILYPPGDHPGLMKILEKVLGKKVTVDKQRDIFFIDNVKFHIDTVKGLGSFLEIEAIGEEGQEKKLNQQCEYYMGLLHLGKQDLLPNSYSDLLMNKE